jgi:hypothetical protein
MGAKTTHVEITTPSERKSLCGVKNKKKGHIPYIINERSEYHNEMKHNKKKICKKGKKNQMKTIYMPMLMV